MLENVFDNVLFRDSKKVGCPASKITALLDVFLTEAVPTNQHIPTFINGLKVINKSPTAGVYMKSSTQSPPARTKLNCKLSWRTFIWRFHTLQKQNEPTYYKNGWLLIDRNKLGWILNQKGLGFWRQRISTSHWFTNSVNLLTDIRKKTSGKTLEATLVLRCALCQNNEIS